MGFFSFPLYFVFYFNLSWCTNRYITVFLNTLGIVFHSDERRTKHYICIVPFMGKADYFYMSNLKYYVAISF